MNKDRTFCKSYDCLTITCSRHRCQLPKWYFKPIFWEEYYKDCEMYKSLDRWETLRDEDEEELEDDWI